MTLKKHKNAGRRPSRSSKDGKARGGKAEHRRRKDRRLESAAGTLARREQDNELATGELVSGFLTCSDVRGHHAMSVWLESERSDRSWRVFLPSRVLQTHAEGDRLRVRITSIEDRDGRRPLVKGRIEDVIATHDDPERAAKGLMSAYGISTDWPQTVQREANALHEDAVGSAQQVRDCETLPSTRRDLCALPLVTIDGESARDFDDAVYCEALHTGGWRLLVAIADVSHYVTPSSAMEAQARQRATSVYLPQHLAPMLPEILSNDLCSLVPNRERAVLAVDMRVAEDGQVQDFMFFQGLMRSAARLTYTRVTKFVDSGEATGLEDTVCRSLESLEQCYQALRMAREKRAALDFDTSEAELDFDQGLVRQVILGQRGVSQRMIEEAMIAANVCAATYLDEADLPLLFRVHPPPSGEKLEALLDTLDVLGVNIRNIDPDRLNALIQKLSQRISPELLATIVLRSMQQAVYTPLNQGHFGLALERYAHFTSPIRRYPDLSVHRAIKHKLGQTSEAELSLESLRDLGVWCSQREREAESCERDVRAWYLAEYAHRHIGESFNGSITGVTSFGLFVLLDELLAEGLLHMRALGNDWFEHDAAAHRLVGTQSGRQFALGDRIKVVIASVDVDRRQIDLVMSRAGRTKAAGRHGVSHARHAQRRGS